MSDPDVTMLLNRAAAHTPPMDISVLEVVEVGRRRVRKRRVVAAGGMTLSTLVAAGALWAGLGGAGVLESQELPPAGMTQQREEPFTQGERVGLLGEVYTVAQDVHGWPQLLEDDGSVFLSVTDEKSGNPSDGGIIHLGGGLRFWQEEAQIPFYVGWQPPDDREVVFQGDDGQWLVPRDVLTIKGPKGVVTLISVPADLSQDFTGLGLRTGDEVTPTSPEPPL